MTSKIQIDAGQRTGYDDHDDALVEAARRVADALGLEAWDLSPRWEDDSRESILIDVPAWAAEDARTAGLRLTEIED